MITVDLYNVNDDKRTVNKKLNSRDTIKATLKEECDIVNPIFLLTKIDNVLNKNYLYCPYLHRYYFIDNIVLGVGGKQELHCSVDVLMTYKSDILKLSAIINRQEKNYQNSGGGSANGQFIDNRYPIRSERTTDIYNIGNVTNKFGYYVTVNGGVI